MVFVYYFAAFISLLREVLRPGVLWFLRNLNDPDFSPIQVCPIFKVSYVVMFNVLFFFVLGNDSLAYIETCSTFDFLSHDIWFSCIVDALDTYTRP